MNPAPTSRYLETQISTASREQLLIMLFDGAIRFAEQGRAYLEEKNFEKSVELLIRAQSIVLEIMSALDRAVGDALYGKLLSLYHFIYRRLVEAGMKRDPAPIADALKILVMMRQTWSEAIAKNGREKAGGTAAAKTGAVQGLSVQG